MDDQRTGAEGGGSVNRLRTWRLAGLMLSDGLAGYLLAPAFVADYVRVSVERMWIVVGVAVLSGALGGLLLESLFRLSENLTKE